MKLLGGIKLKQRTKTVCIGEDEDGQPVKLVLAAPRMGFAERFTQEVPEPVAPAIPGKVERDPKTGEPIKDSAGCVIPIRNPLDPGHRKAVTQWNVQLVVAMVLECAGDQIEIGAHRSEFNAPGEFYDAALEEMGEVFDAGQFKLLMAAAKSLCAVTEEEQEESRSQLEVPSGE